MMTTGNRKPDAVTSGFHGSDKNGGRLSLSASDNTTTRRARQVLRNCHGQICGRVENGVLVKDVNHERHFLKAYNAWALDLAHLDQLEQWRIDPVELRDVDGSVWRVTVADFRAYGFDIDHGHGRQRALSVNRWQHVRPGEPVQLGLF